MICPSSVPVGRCGVFGYGCEGQASSGSKSVGLILLEEARIASHEVERKECLATRCQIRSKV